MINENLPKEIEKLPLHLFGESGTDSSSESSDSEYSDVSSEVEYMTKYIDPPKIACSSISTQCEPTIDGIPIEESEDEVHSVITHKSELPIIVVEKPKVKIDINEVALRF